MFEVWYSPRKGSYVKLSCHYNAMQAMADVMRMKPGRYSIWDDLGNCYARVRVGRKMSRAVGTDAPATSLRFACN